MSSTLFNGTSRYSTDFQSVVQRSVAIASLPLTQMKAGLTTLNSESAALSSLDQAFAGLKSAISGIATSVSSSAYRATTSDSNVAAFVTAGASTGTYTVEITNLGSVTRTMSRGAGGGITRVTDPSTGNPSGSGPTVFHLVINGGDAIEITASNLHDLAEQINAKAGTDIHATLVNVGSTDGQPDYRLSMQSQHLRPDTISLTAGTIELLSPLNTGHAVTYKVNGAAEASSESRTIEIAPGLSIQATKKSEADSPTTVEVARSSAALSSALQSFASAYNMARDAIDKNRGEDAGALSGQSILLTLSDLLRRMSNYQSGSGTVASAADLGLQLDRNGRLSLDVSTFNAAASRDLEGLSNWIGADSSGFAKALNSLCDVAENADSGYLKSSIKQNSDLIAAQNRRIADEQTRIDNLTASLQERMAAADALIASLEQQATYVSNMFESMQIAGQGYSR